MIEKLNIENFMLFKKLEIPTLKRVNLIGGRNNSGKTALLEALRILASSGDIGVINQILKYRQTLINGNAKSYDELFNRYSINALPRYLSLNEFSLIKRALSFKNNNQKFEIIGGSEPDSYLLNDNSTIIPVKDKNIFLPFNADFTILNNLWESIVLTTKEDEVIDILRQTVESNVSRLDVGQNMVRVKLSNNDKPVPLGTLGDGVRRVFLIALGLANAPGHCLFIDEIELGLHHSVLEKLWKMIFKYAKKWNIQVFVTTHSQDALRTFAYIASEEDNKDDAQFIRLQIGRTGENEAILFDSERLINTLDLQLEIR